MRNEPVPGRSDNQHVIRASELAQFSFCQRAWWLAVVKDHTPKNQVSLSRGILTHNRHFHQIQTAQRWRYASFFLLYSGGLLLVVVLLWHILNSYF